MGAVRRVFSFGAGGVLGFVVGAAVARLLAEESGDDLRRLLHERVDRVKAAGDAAQARVEAELIGKFRAEINDPTALQDQAEQATIRGVRAIEALGLGFNAQGALAALEVQERAADAERARQRELSGGRR
ncbi:MAG: YtxH domain-containing protein [Thermomicrobiales bacterium]|nr:YtxH domain-containing protein [Thermomicrobiales bacterium]